MKNSVIQTGFKSLDKMMCISPSDLIVIASRPSMGKTTMEIAILNHNVIDAGKSCILFSLDMDRNQIIHRMIAQEADISHKEIRKYSLDENKRNSVELIKRKIESSGLIVDDTSFIDISEIVKKCKSINEEKELDLIVIDYLQLVQDESIEDQRHDGYRALINSYITRKLKKLAEDTKTPVILLSQVPKTVLHRENKRPNYQDLRLYGAIEQDADTLMYIYRDDFYNEREKAENRAEIIIEKNRGCPTGVVCLNFNKDIPNFKELEDRK